MITDPIEKVEEQLRKIDLPRLLVWQHMFTLCSKSKREANAAAAEFRKLQPNATFSGADIHARAPKLLALCNKLVAEHKGRK